MTRRDVIQAANAVDLANARSEGLSAAFVDRLAVTDRVLDQMVTGVRQIAELADPVGGIENLRPYAIGHPCRPHACAARCHRHDL